MSHLCIGLALAEIQEGTARQTEETLYLPLFTDVHMGALINEF